MNKIVSFDDNKIIDKFQVKENTWEPDNEDLIGNYTWDEANEQIKLLNSLKYKGFSNWRLPTKEELNWMYENKNKIGGFSSSFYWSSTELYGNFVGTQSFNDGYQLNFYKINYLRVRCVRDK